MIGGLLRTTSLAALLAVGGLVGGMSQANAADLGGDCCADLEERVAELEATTARKGNRKVSLTVSGQVNELVYWWDDGHESNVYVGTSGYSSSRFRFKGDAKINADWSAGYYMEIEVVSAQVNANSATQTIVAATGLPTGGDDGAASANAVKLRQSNWYLKSKTLGTITVGQQSHATDDIVLYSLAGLSTWAGANYNVAPGAGIGLRHANGASTAITMASLFEFIDSDRANVVRYDSPSLAGFVLSASWGEDDMWDVALRYAGEFAGIKIAGGIGYHEERDRNGDDGAPNIGFRPAAGGDCPAAAPCQADFNDIRGSISVMHEPSGLFVDFASVRREYESDTGALAAGVTSKEDMFFWTVKAGIQQKWFALGKTALWGEYGNVDGALTGRAVDVDGPADAGARRVLSDEGTTYGLGIAQNIDAAAMELYIGWRHFEADVVINPDGNIRQHVPLDDIDTVYTGARIQF